jgi:hypothetical protein
MSAGDWLNEFIPETAKRPATVLDAVNIRAPAIPSLKEETSAPELRRFSPLGAVVLAGIAGFAIGRLFGGRPN